MKISADDKKNLELLNKWLDKNSKAELAAFMGYTSTTAIDQWNQRGRIPRHQTQRVMQRIKGASK